MTNPNTPTPRTDAKAKELLGYYDLNSHDRFDLMTEHAEDLECALAAMTAERDALKRELEQLKGKS